MIEKNNVPIQAEENDFDQTMFSTEVLFEKPTLPQAPVAVVVPTEKKKIPLWKQKKVLLLLGVGSVALLFIVLVAVAPKQKKLKKIVKNDVVVTQHPQQNALKARLDEVNIDLENADPSKMDLPFPPIEKNITIE